MKELQKDHSKHEEEKSLVDIGSCSLHVVHNAAKTGFQKAEWKIKLIRALHNLFNYNPSRRKDYGNASGSEVFPLPFC